MPACLLLCGLLLAGCATSPEPPGEVPRLPDETQAISATSPVDELLILAGAAADPVEAAGYFVEAARLLWDEGDVAGTDEILAFIDTAPLSPLQMEGIRLLQAEIAAVQGEPGQVLALLLERNFPGLERLDERQRIRFHELRAEAFLENNSALQSAQERIRLDRVLPQAALAENHELVWQALARLPQAQLETMSAAAINYELQGWYQLALIGKTWSDDLDRQLIELRRWRTAWARHPAARILPREMEMAETMASERPQQLALLLPLGTTAGTIVRDAFMSAYFNLQELGGQVPAIRFYDTSNTTDILALHRQAREDGAQLIIGPLLKQHVAALQAEPDLGVPTLALNNVEGLRPASPLLYQFALSPEHEARQVADKAWRDGHRRVAILSPLDEAGNDFFARKRDSFVAAWEALGGHVVAQDIYTDNYTGTITDLLELDASTARVEDIRQVVGRPVIAEQRRRQDIDFIHLVAQTAPARQIVPSLAYLYAGDIPVYASQDVYAGIPRPVEDRDLNGVIFGESPWLLDTAAIDAGPLRELFPLNTAQNLRLQAFGIDAFRLYPRLRLLESSPESRMPGATGMLRLGANQNIERELTWTTITDGLARPLTR